MVGAKAGRAKVMVELDNFINEIRKSDYDPTGKDGDNCFSMIMKWIGAPSTGDISHIYTHGNLNAHWKHDNTKTILAMVKYYAPYVDRIDKKDMKIGDIVLIRDKKGLLTPSIFSGNSKVFTMLYQGCYHLKLNQFEIVEVFRKVNELVK